MHVSYFTGSTITVTTSCVDSEAFRTDSLVGIVSDSFGLNSSSSKSPFYFNLDDSQGRFLDCDVSTESFDAVKFPTHR